LTLSGWTVRGEWPELDKAVAIVAPHTSNWDGPILLAAAGYLRVKPKWLGKASLANGPFGGLLRWLGCIPIDRSAGGDVVRTVSEAFAAHDRMILGLAPEGTRSLTPEWKSGFYRMACAAGVPIILGVIDYRTRTVSLAAVIHPTGDYAVDLVRIQSHYRDAVGKNPDQTQCGTGAFPPAPDDS
tara:strand:+ start:304 stop:855 length:552 start_codon:yes stop_codon:yes gene_type:complete